MAKGAKGPSLRSVAEAAGVSLTTASNAYNKPDHLSTEVREMIFTIAREQGYAGPNPAARSLRSGRNGAIGVLFTLQLSYAFSDPYCVSLLAGVAEMAERSLNSMVLIPLAPRSAVFEDSLRESFDAVRYALIDGVVADGIDDSHPALQVLNSRGLPVVRSMDAPDSRCVLIEEREAGRSVATYLAALGHRNVAVLVDGIHGSDQVDAQIDESVLYPYTRLRLAGITEGFGPTASVTVISAGPNAKEYGRMATERVLKLQPRPTAVVSSTDTLALGALEVLKEHGIEPGVDISVTGFDDIPMAAAFGLTTVRQPIREKGRIMGRMLLDSTFVQQRVVLPTELVTRASTGPAK